MTRWGAAASSGAVELHEPPSLPGEVPPVPFDPVELPLPGVAGTMRPSQPSAIAAPNGSTAKSDHIELERCLARIE